MEYVFRGQAHLGRGHGDADFELVRAVAPPDELQALLARREGEAGARAAKPQPPQ